jgi:hypothetical protein
MHEKDILKEFLDINGESIMERVIEAKKTLADVLQSAIRAGYDLKERENDGYEI